MTGGPVHYEKVAAMFHIESPLNEVDLAKLTFGEKINLAKELAKNYGLTIFVAMLTGLIVIGLVSIVMMSFVDFSLLTGSGFNGRLLLRFIPGAAFFMAVIGFIGLLFAIGINSLILQYIDAYEPYSIFSVVMAPWAKLGTTMTPGLLLWVGAHLICAFMMGLASMIPLFGAVIASLGYMFFLLVACCAGFNFADLVVNRDEDLSAWEAVCHPCALVKNNLAIWLSVFAVIVLLSLPADLLLGLGAFMAMGGRSGFFAICLGLAMIYFLITSIFMAFFVALTYRQSRAQSSGVGSNGDRRGQ